MVAVDHFRLKLKMRTMQSEWSTEGGEEEEKDDDDEQQEKLDA